VGIMLPWELEELPVDHRTMFTEALTGLAVLIAGACAMHGQGRPDRPASTTHGASSEDHVSRAIASGKAEINGARIYYELAGDGPPLVMLHAGVADGRQWNGEFERFSREFRVLRYDLRGYGKSEPVAGDFNHLQDLMALLAHLKIEEPVIVMGSSMGGGIAMDFALEHSARVRAIIMVGSGPTGLALDVPAPAKLEEIEQAYALADYERVAELRTQLWFDGEGRSPNQVDPEMRRLAHDMNRGVVGHETKQLGKRLPNARVPAVERLNQLSQPVLVIVGEHDIPYIRAAAAYMASNIPTAQQHTMADAAHLPNMDHPEVFQQLVASFLSTLNQR
jgi:3-oxoadipate enol-lactonase